ncbi:MAG: TM0996/MTH895 family glutaredoxin-like protein [Verrucomicrobia bacterium]|nr:TM0996/MTH895 family glutaredoxin-like protein [Verrucomicrobiota bacterium]
MTQLLVLGPGCSRCNALLRAVRQAADELGLNYELNKVSDLRQIMALGVMATPALAVNGTVKVVGRVPPLQELKQILQDATVEA